MPAVCAACGAPMSNHLSTCPNRFESDENEIAKPAAGRSRSQAEDGFSEPLLAVLAYITVIPAIILLLRARYKKNRFLRFHALQSIALAAASIALATIFLLLSNVPTLNLFLIPAGFVAVIGITLVVLVCMIKAYQHQIYKLPFIGNWAEKLGSRC